MKRSFIYRWRDVWNARAQPALQRSGMFWQQLSLRERRLLRLAGLLLMIAALWLVGLRPALDTLRQAREQLPVLQAQAAELQAIVLESRALGQHRRGAMSLEESAAALQTSLQQAGLQASARFGPTLPMGDEVVRELTIEQAVAADLLAWLERLPELVQVRVHRLDLIRSHVDGRDHPGLLSGTIQLALSAGSMP